VALSVERCLACEAEGVATCGALPRFRLRQAYGATGCEAEVNRGLVLRSHPPNEPAASHPRGLEGSRFVAWQLCRLVAGGSRELSMVLQLYRVYVKRGDIAPNRWVKRLVEKLPGAAC
jgi:hypothetical protein